MGLGQFLDRAIAPLAPRWALERAKSRARFELLSTFEAAERGRLTADNKDRTTSADQAVLPDLPTINARARAAARDDWAASSIIQGYRRHVTGTGISARSNARDRDGNPFEEFNRTANRLWGHWAKRARLCDIERRKSLVEIQGLAISEFATVGQSLVIMAYRRRPGVSGLMVQMVEPEQLDLTLTRNPENGNVIRGGVEVDGDGAPLAYWIYTAGLPNELSYDQFRKTKSQRVDADRVLHFYRQDRPRQTQGVTRLASVLKKLRHLQMYDEYMLVRARYEAAIGASIETSEFGDPGSYLPSAAEVEDNSDGAASLTIEPGMLLDPGPGKTINWHVPSTPGNMYGPFVTQQLTEASAGAGLDFATVARDFTKGSFSSQRQGTLERDKETDPLQMLLVDLVLRPLRDEFITLEILEGRLDAPGFFSDPELALLYLEAEWQPPAKPWIDPANQAAAAKIALDYRLTTRGRELNELGEDVYETFDRIDDEQAYAHELGIGLPDAPPERGGFKPSVSPNEPRPGADNPNLTPAGSK